MNRRSCSLPLRGILSCFLKRCVLLYHQKENVAVTLHDIASELLIAAKIKRLQGLAILWTLIRSPQWRPYISGRLGSAWESMMLRGPTSDTGVISNTTVQCAVKFKVNLTRRILFGTFSARASHGESFIHSAFVVNFSRFSKFFKCCNYEWPTSIVKSQQDTGLGQLTKWDACVRQWLLPEDEEDPFCSLAATESPLSLR